MPTRSADDFDTIRENLEKIRKREGESLKTPINESIKEDKEPTPMADEYYGCGYYTPYNITVKD